MSYMHAYYIIDHYHSLSRILGSTRPRPGTHAPTGWPKCLASPSYGHRSISGSPWPSKRAKKHEYTHADTPTRGKVDPGTCTCTYVRGETCCPRIKGAWTYALACARLHALRRGYSCSSVGARPCMRGPGRAVGTPGAPPARGVTAERPGHRGQRQPGAGRTPLGSRTCPPWCPRRKRARCLRVLPRARVLMQCRARVRDILRVVRSCAYPTRATSMRRVGACRGPLTLEEVLEGEAEDEGPFYVSQKASKQRSLR